jgi:hypothetical protein
MSSNTARQRKSSSASSPTKTKGTQKKDRKSKGADDDDMDWYQGPSSTSIIQTRNAVVVLIIAAIAGLSFNHFQDRDAQSPSSGVDPNVGRFLEQTCSSDENDLKNPRRVFCHESLQPWRRTHKAKVDIPFIQGYKKTVLVQIPRTYLITDLDALRDSWIQQHFFNQHNDDKEDVTYRPAVTDGGAYLALYLARIYQNQTVLPELDSLGPVEDPATDSQSRDHVIRNLYLPTLPIAELSEQVKKSRIRNKAALRQLKSMRRGVNVDQDGELIQEEVDALTVQEPIVSHTPYTYDHPLASWDEIVHLGKLLGVYSSTYATVTALQRQLELEYDRFVAMFAATSTAPLSSVISRELYNACRIIVFSRSKFQFEVFVVAARVAWILTFSSISGSIHSLWYWSTVKKGVRATS